MEIGDYLNLVRSRARLFLLVPVIAGLLVGASLLISHDQRFVSSATVSVSSFSGAPGSQFAGTQGNRLLLESMGAAAETPTVLNRVSDETGVPVEVLERGEAITVAPIGGSSLVRVTARVPQREDAAAVATSVAVQSLRFLIEPQVAVSQELVEQAEQTVSETEARLSEARAASGLTLGVADYEAKARALAASQESLLRARAAGDARLTAALSASIDEQSAALAAMTPQLAGFERLIELNRQAVGRVNAATTALEEARAVLVSADSGSLVTLGETRKQPLGPQLVRGLAGGVGAGILIASLMIVLLEFFGRGQRSVVGDSDRVSDESAESRRSEAVTPGDRGDAGGSARPVAHRSGIE